MTPLLLFALLTGEGCPSLVPAAARAEAYQSYVTGQVHANEGRFAEALVSLEAAVRADPLLPQAHYARGQALMGLRRFDDAIDAFLECKDAFRCRAGLDEGERADMEREISQLRDAIRTVDREDLVRSSIPGREANQEVTRSRGETMRLVAALEERLGELEAWRRRGWESHPPAVVFVALGTAYVQTGAMAEAEQELEAALALEPKNGDAHHNLAVVYLATGRLGEAERELKAAEKAGIGVNPRLREEIQKRRSAPRP